jgi:hypothetical protein
MFVFQVDKKYNQNILNLLILNDLEMKGVRHVVERHDSNESAIS